MKTQEISIQQLGIKAGLLASLSLICYFLLMKYSGLIHVTELRALNFLILAGTIALTFRYLRVNSHRSISYLEGFSMSCIITGVSVITFSLFIYFYFSVLDPTLLEELKNHTPLVGSYLAPSTAAASVLVEGLCSGFILSFSYMQFYQSRFSP